MDDYEILETTKINNPNRVGFAESFTDQILIKSKVPRWKEFPAHILPAVFVDDYEHIKNFKVYEDDVWLIGFPRSGTTLLQELVWIITNDFNINEATKADTYSRVRFFDFWTSKFKVFNSTLDGLDKTPRPRVFKSHLPVQFLPDEIWTVKPRIVHISRDARDAAVSFYYLRKDILHDDVGTMEEHFEEVLNDKTWWCPYRQHVANYQNLPDYENIFYLTYEELVTDMEGMIRKLATFLNKDATEDNVAKLVEYLSFENMKKNKMINLQDQLDSFKAEGQHDRPTNTYIRKGIIGDHKNCMPEETIKRFDEWIEEKTSVKFPVW